MRDEADTTDKLAVNIAVAIQATSHVRYINLSHVLDPKNERFNKKMKELGRWMSDSLLKGLSIDQIPRFPRY